MTSTYVAHNVPDLLDTLPALFGFTPKESFIAIATVGRRHRFGFRLRMDMPARADVAKAACQVARYLRRQDPDGAVLIALTEDSDAGDALVAAVRAELGTLPIHEAVRATQDRYWTYSGGRPDEPVAYVSRCSEVVVEAIVHGRQILPDREALVAKFGAVSGARAEQMAAVTDRALGAAVQVMAECPTADLGVAGMARLAPIIAAHADGIAMNDADLATLAVWVSAVQVRDHVWSRMDQTNAQQALELWTAVAQVVVEPFEPPVLCLAAFAAWLTGDGAQALIAVERAKRIQWDYSLADLILRLIMSAMPPDEWEGFDPQAPTTS